MSTEWTIASLLLESKRLQSILPPLFTWEDLLSAANNCDLGLLHRHPILLELYTNEFTPLVKAQHGSVENYLRESLGPWKEVLPSSEFCWKNGMECKVKLNDWGYALPLNVSHYVIWTPLPVVHLNSINSSTQWTWERISEKGLAGFTGLPAELLSLYSDKGGANGPGKEISEFAQETWKEEGFECIWYVNPPRLQSVQGLAHFHVLVRSKK